MKNCSVYPMSNAQKRLWLLDKMEGKNAYNLPAAYELKREIDWDNFKNSIYNIIIRHESLRTTFNTHENEPVQIVHDKISIPCKKISVKNENQALDFITKEVFTPFDLINGPMLRCHYVNSPEKNWLVFNMHHIISDGWSISNLINELKQEYIAGINETSQIENLSFQYKDYTKWQLSAEGKNLYDRQKEYWIKQLQGELPITEIKPDNKRPMIKGYDGSKLERKLDENLARSIKQFCKEKRVSMFVFFQSVIHLILHKYTGNNDIIVGSPVAGRSKIETERLIGFFVNTIAIRSKIDINKRFNDFMLEMQQTINHAFANQDYPFDELVNTLDIPRDTSRNPIFNIMVAYQNIVTESLALGESELTPIKDLYNVSKFDITISLVDMKNQVKLAVEYSNDLYCRKTIDEFLERINIALNHILQDSQKKISEYELYTETEKTKIKHELGLNFKSNNYLGFVDKIKQHALSIPNKIALSNGSFSLSYSEIDMLSDTISSNLHKKYGCLSGKRVALLMKKSPYLPVVALAILKCGAIYVPLDDRAPKSRISYILSDSESSILISDSNNLDYDIETCNFTTLRKESEAIRQNHERENLVILYTSGTTGKPKGTIIRQDAVTRIIHDENLFNDDNDIRFIATNSPAFDATLFEIWIPILLGGFLWIDEINKTIEPNAFKKITIENNINTAIFVTGLLRQICAEDVKALANLGTLLVGGEKFPVKLAVEIKKQCPNLKLINCYGPTENGIISTIYEINGTEDVIPIGKNVNGTGITILNSDLSPAFFGEKGEICLIGEGLSEEYINVPNLSAERFCETTILDTKVKIYRTGDIGYFGRDDNFYIEGRSDDQIKINGFRVETSAIESCATKLDEIESAVIKVYEENDNKQVALFVKGNISDIKVLKSHLKANLPDYMNPKWIEFVKEFPLTVNGKIDYNKLNITNKHAENDDITIELKPLQEIWRRVLNHEPKSVDTSFFEIGGNSIKAIQLSAKILDEMNLEVTIHEIFLHPRLQEMYQLLQAKSVVDKEKIKRIEDRSYYPMSPSQRRLWVLEQLGKTDGAYNIAAAVKIEDEIDFERIETAFLKVIEKHEILRTTFTEVDEIPYQIILNDINWSLESSSCRSEAEQLSKVQSFAIEQFDLSKSPLFRAKLFQHDDHSSVLALNMHHIISDGWSIDIVIRDFLNAYNDIEISKNKVRYCDYTEWLNRQIPKHADFWDKQMAGELEIISLQTDYKRPEVKTYNGNTLKFQFNELKTKQIREFQYKENVTLYAFMNSILKVMLWKLANQKDIIIGSPFSCRDRSEVQEIIGYFVNTLPIRDRVDSDETFKEFLQKSYANLLKIMEHQEYPLDQIIGNLNLQRDTSRSPLFDIVLSVRPEIKVEEMEKLGFSNYSFDFGYSKFDLLFEFNETAEKIELNIEYNTDLYKEETIRTFFNLIGNVIDQVLECSDQKIRNIDLLDDNYPEMKKILKLNNNVLDSDKNIVEMFQKQVEIHGNESAVIHNEKTLTYDEINSLSDQIAYGILKNNESSKVKRVAVLLNNSVELPAILLGVIKSGAAYVPIDPSHPEKRIRFIIEDSECSILLTNLDLENSLVKNLKNVGIKILYPHDFVNNFPCDLPNLNTCNELYVIYTSGSTGNPKGCRLTHKNLINLINTTKNKFGFNKNDVWSMAHSFCFDFSVWEIFGSLLTGGTLVIPEREVAKNIVKFVEFVEKHEVTILNQTPQSFYSFSDIVSENKMLSLKIRKVIFGGDKLDFSKLKDWIDLYPLTNTQLINMYGITEITVHGTYYEITESDIYDENCGSVIGNPLENYDMKIVNEDRNVVPDGFWGEIAVAGYGVCSGYINREDLNSEKFSLVNGFSDEYYFSGDVGRWKNGQLEYLNRKDFQIQLRGFRVEPDEINNVIKELAGVEESIVLCRKHAGEDALIAWIQTKSISDVDIVRDKIKSKLPEYMVPSFFCFVETLPLTINGKVDRKNLPDYRRNSESVENQSLDDIESSIATCWQSVLEVENIGLRDNFFEVGGNSLLLIKLQRQLQKLYPSVFELTDLFNLTTVFEQAERVRGLTKTNFQQWNGIELENNNEIAELQNMTFELPSDLSEKLELLKRQERFKTAICSMFCYLWFEVMDVENPEILLNDISGNRWFLSVDLSEIEELSELFELIDSTLSKTQSIFSIEKTLAYNETRLYPAINLSDERIEDANFIVHFNAESIVLELSEKLEHQQIVLLIETYMKLLDLVE
jgi:tyrocidine synthetase-3